ADRGVGVGEQVGLVGRLVEVGVVVPRLLLVVVGGVDGAARRRVRVVVVQAGGQVGVEDARGPLVAVRQVLLVGQAVAVAVPGVRAVGVGVVEPEVVLRRPGHGVRPGQVGGIGLGQGRIVQRRVVPGRIVPGGVVDRRVVAGLGPGRPV